MFQHVLVLLFKFNLLFLTQVTSHNITTTDWMSTSVSDFPSVFTIVVLTYNTHIPNLHSRSTCRKEIHHNSTMLYYTTANFNISKLSKLSIWNRLFLSTLGAYAKLHYQVSCMSHKQSMVHSYYHTACK